MIYRVREEFFKGFNLTQVLLKLEKVGKYLTVVEAELNLELMKITAPIFGAQRILQSSKEPIPFYY